MNDRAPTPTGDDPLPAIDVVIYHNPACGTSRNALAMIRNAAVGADASGTPLV